eukprot:2602163-Alexandrium_andersonii.AAC.1
MCIRDSGNHCANCLAPDGRRIGKRIGCVLGWLVREGRAYARFTSKVQRVMLAIFRKIIRQFEDPLARAKLCSVRILGPKRT